MKSTLGRFIFIAMFAAFFAASGYSPAFSASKRASGQKLSLTLRSPVGEGRSLLPTVAIAENPTYHYDPALNLRGVDVQEKLELPPGPNNPVGIVWIALSSKGYGIHGTPDPEAVSKRASHGCIRLTNWDALELAKHVRKGTPVRIDAGSAKRQAKRP